MDYDDRHSALGAAAGLAIADDGRTLNVWTFEPSAPALGVVLVVPAMATAASFYAAFAKHLASRGFRTVTFDYRGMGTPAELRAEPGNLDRWAGDARDVLAHVVAQSPGLPVTWIGHSLGGQILPFADHSLLSAAVTVTSGSGYTKYSAPRTRALAPLLWYAIAPVAIRRYGYFAGSRIGILGDVPREVMRQWSRWCRHPEYLRLDHPDAPELFAAVTVPLMSLSFADDELLSKKSIDRLHAWYTGTEVVRRHYQPKQLGISRVGHHGIFRSRHARLWDDLVVPWLAASPARR
jgi:predicted alpha/beta hydrolase